MSKKLKSIFTKDLECCYYTGTPYPDRHHIFESFNRSLSEKYDFVIPLCQKLHVNGVHVDDEFIKSITGFEDRWAFDEWLKQECQRHYEKTHSREEFLKEFGRSWL